MPGLVNPAGTASPRWRLSRCVYPPGSWNCHYFTLLSRSSSLVAGAALPWDNLGFPACAGKWKPLSSLWMETWDFPSQGLRAKSL